MAGTVVTYNSGIILSLSPFLSFPRNDRHRCVSAIHKEVIYKEEYESSSLLLRLFNEFIFTLRIVHEMLPDPNKFIPDNPNVRKIIRKNGIRKGRNTGA